MRQMLKKLDDHLAAATPREVMERMKAEIQGQVAVLQARLAVIEAAQVQAPAAEVPMPAMKRAGGHRVKSKTGTSARIHLERLQLEKEREERWANTEECS